MAFSTGQLQLANTRVPDRRHARPCPTLRWQDNLAQSNVHGTAAIYTPYHITYGGGEKYLLQTASVLQSMGYKVDVLVNRQNTCQTIEDLHLIGAGLRVPLSIEMLELIHVDIYGGKISTAHQYDIFFLLGNEKYPGISPLGRVNLYMCQFPFDLNRTVTSSSRRILELYDTVLVNSHFSYRWYVAFMLPVFLAARQDTLSFPAVEILSPPVTPFIPGTSHRRKIVLLGRFFQGRQSKGHFTAIEIFKTILPDLPATTELHFVGNLAPGHEEYLSDLQDAARDLPILFDIGASPHAVEKILQESLVQWHLTGISADLDIDPASGEHFGIAVAEGMSAGCIPIVYERGGGVTEIVSHNDTGFLADDKHHFGEYTKLVFSMSSEQLSLFRGNAVEAVKIFHPGVFAATLTVLIKENFLTRIWKSFMRQTGPSVLSRSFDLPSHSPYVAVIIETRPHYALEYVVKNVMAHLSSAWSLHVFHGKLNGDFAQTVLSSLHGVKYTELDIEVTSVRSYNSLMKSANLWLALDAEKALIFQVDSVMVRQLDRRMLMYDYIGAPWGKENVRWPSAAPDGVGNGGFSLRSVQAMLDVIAEHGEDPTSAEPEDVYFAHHLVNSTVYNVAPRDMAYQFSIEVPCRDIEERIPDAHIPVAIHKAWVYFSNEPIRLITLQAFFEVSVCTI